MTNKSAGDLTADSGQAEKASQSAAVKPDQKTFVVSNENKTITLLWRLPIQIHPPSFRSVLKKKPDESVSEALSDAENLEVPESFLSVPNLLDGVQVTADKKDLLVQVNGRLSIESAADADLLKKMLKETLTWSPYERIKLKRFKTEPDRIFINLTAFPLRCPYINRRTGRIFLTATVWDKSISSRLNKPIIQYIRLLTG